MRLAIATITAFVFTALAGAAGGDLLWLDQVDRAAGFDTAIAVTTGTDRVYSAGLVTTLLGDTDFVVRANELSSGRLLWEDTYDQAGSNDAATSVVASGGIVFAAGSVVSPAGNLDFFARAYDEATGAVAWQDQVDRTGGRDVAVAVASSVGRFYAAGFVTEAFGNRDFLIRAYDAKTGVVQWENQLDLAGFKDQATLGSMIVSGGRIFVGGLATNLSGGEDLLLMSYDTQTGQLVWQQVFDSGGFDAAKSITARWGRLFVAGYQADPSNYTRFTIRAYDAQTGVLVWENHDASSGPGFDYANGVVTSNGRVYAAGFGTSLSGKQVYLVRAYNASSGQLLWEDAADKGGSFDYATSIATSRDRVYTAGSGGAGCGAYPVSNCGMLLRSYEGKSGRLLWEDAADLPYGDDLAKALVLQSQKLVAIGYVTNALGDQDYAVRVVEAD